MEPWHGTAGGYTNHGCRCDDCSAAHSAYYTVDQLRREAERTKQRTAA